MSKDQEDAVVVILILPHFLFLSHPLIIIYVCLATCATSHYYTILLYLPGENAKPTMLHVTVFTAASLAWFEFVLWVSCFSDIIITLQPDLGTMQLASHLLQV